MLRRARWSRTVAEMPANAAEQRPTRAAKQSSREQLGALDRREQFAKMLDVMAARDADKAHLESAAER